MSEYAQELIDNNIGDWYSCHTKRTYYIKKTPKEKIINGDITKNIWSEYSQYEFKKIVAETNKSWLLEMSGGAIQHYSKKHCEIKENLIIVPKWLLCKIAGWIK